MSKASTQNLTLKNQTPRRSIVFNGPALLAAMFRELDPIFRKKLYKKLKTVSPIIAKLVENLEFVFSDLVLLDDQSIQLILQKIPENDWLLAWKLADANTKARILKNMSERRKNEFLRLAQTQPRVLKQQVAAVQFKIANQVRKLLEQGILRMHAKRRKIRRFKKKENLRKQG